MREFLWCFSFSVIFLSKKVASACHNSYTFLWDNCRTPAASVVPILPYWILKICTHGSRLNHFYCFIKDTLKYNRPFFFSLNYKRMLVEMTRTCSRGWYHLPRLSSSKLGPQQCYLTIAFVWSDWVDHSLEDLKTIPANKRQSQDLDSKLCALSVTPNSCPSPPLWALDPCIALRTK